MVPLGRVIVLDISFGHIHGPDSHLSPYHALGQIFTASKNGDPRLGELKIPAQR